MKRSRELVLERIYGARTEVPQVKEKLADELRVEDERRDRVVRILAGAGADEKTLASFADWSAFSGGADNLQASVRHATADVVAAAASTGAEVPEMYCGLWPDRSLNARTLRTEFGGVVLVNTGLLTALNVFLDAVARSLGHLFGPLYGQDDESQDRIARMLDWLMIKHQAGIDVRYQSQVLVMGGPREQFRRKMTWAALCYVIAHEAGHLARSRPCRGGWRDDNQLFQLFQVPEQPGSEFDVTDAARSEEVSDTIACRILRRPPLRESHQPSLTQTVGAISVLALQNAAFWRKAALTDEPLGWTHPYPEGRMYGLIVGLASPAKQLEALEGEAPTAAAAAESETETQVLARRFVEWSQDVLGTTMYRLVASERGLGSRGLNPESLAMLYVTDPLMKQEPSDIVTALSTPAGTPDLAAAKSAPGEGGRTVGA